MMSLLTLHETIKLEEACARMLQNTNIQFTGIINNKGRLVAGGFRKEFASFETEKLAMLFMEIYLDYSMRKEFDSILGKINFITSHRQQTNVTAVPFDDNLILILSEPSVDIENIIEISKIMFNCCNKIENSKNGLEYGDTKK